MTLFENMLANLGAAGLFANILKTGAAISVCTLLACSGDCSSGNPVDEQNSDDVSVAETEITGVTQKGPFLMGSKVQMFEISNGRSLNQTGKSFNGKISNDKGEFKINGSKLVSQYVVLEASGYYRNENTGKNSNSELTLLAVSNVKDRNTININLLTHLEYERVNYLVTENNAKVDEAKRQAQKEILKIFDIDNSNFSNSEDLNIVGASDEDGALLAVSILLQGDRSESQLSELLTKIAIDMEEDGKWEDNAKRNEIADWAAEIVQSGRVATIRENIEKWKLSSVVPNFEKYINNFWWNNYGFATCDKDHNGKILQNANKQSEKYKTYYICKEGLWKEASALEFDTYQWASGKDGDNKYGSVNSKNCYVFEDKAWRSGDASDCSLGLRGCTALRQDTVGKGSDKIFHICDEKSWRNATTYEKDTFGWKKSTDGSIKKGNVTDSIYVFDKTAWRTASNIEAKLGGCVRTIADSIGKVGSTYYICRSNKWIEASAIEYDTYHWKNGKDGDSKYGSVNTKNCYVYENKIWRSGNSNDCTLKLRGCTALRQDTVGFGGDKAWYMCDEKTWRIATNIEKDTATWGNGKIDGEIRAGQVNRGIYYIYETGKKAWRDATTLEKDTYDYKNNKDWEDGADGEIKKGSVTDSIYVFDATAWRVADKIEKTLGGCVAAIQDSVGKSGNSYYICNPRKWNVATDIQYDTYKQECSEFGQIVYGRVNVDYAYFCYGKVWKRFYGNESINYGKMIDNRDGQIYRTVKINGQTWMAENLNYADAEKYPSMKNKTREDKYGMLYTWAAAIDSVQIFISTGKKCGHVKQKCNVENSVKGICPNGWHLPNISDFEKLIEFAEIGKYGRDQNIGTKLKSKYGWSGEMYTGTDDYGFSGISEQHAYYWYSNEDQRLDYVGGFFFLGFNREGFDQSGASPGWYAYVRCVKD